MPPCRQQVHVVDAVRAGDHPRHQQDDLGDRVRPAHGPHLHALVDQIAKTSPLGQRQRRRRPGARHQVRVIEIGRNNITDPHLPGAHPGRETRSLTRPILSTPQRIRRYNPPANPNSIAGSGLSAKRCIEGVFNNHLHSEDG